MRKSMHQTLPLVVGALTLLADSYVHAALDTTQAVKAEPEGTPTSGADLLHSHAYDLYTHLRPATAGEWGKKSLFSCEKALALRYGHEEEWQRWQEKDRDGGDGEEKRKQKEEQEPQVKREEE